MAEFSREKSGQWVRPDLFYCGSGLIDLRPHIKCGLGYVGQIWVGCGLG